VPTAGILRSVSALWGLPMAPSMSVAEAGSQVRNFRKPDFRSLQVSHSIQTPLGHLS